jgi:hypothetical protein
MNDRIILNVGSVAQPDVVNVTPDCAVTPNRSFFPKMNVADDLSTYVHICRGVDLRVNTTKRSDHVFADISTSLRPSKVGGRSLRQLYICEI